MPSTWGLIREPAAFYQTAWQIADSMCKLGFLALLLHTGGAMLTWNQAEDTYLHLPARTIAHSALREHPTSSRETPLRQTLRLLPVRGRHHGR